MSTPRAASNCGHDHSGDPLGGYVCQVNGHVHQSTRMECATIVVAPDRTLIAMKCNATGAALMVETLLAEATKAKRPTDCKSCADSHDAMLQALVIMKQVPKKC